MNYCVLLLLLSPIGTEMVIFTSGADDPSRYGLAMWISNGRLYLRINTRSKEWTVVTSAFRFHEFMTMKFTWSFETGRFDVGCSVNL